MRQVRTELLRLGRLGRVMLLAQRLAIVAAWVLGAMLAFAVFDFALRLPSAFRLVALLIGAAALGWALWRYLGPAWLFRPTLTQLALRVERVMPSVAGRLASSVEFAATGVDQTNLLAARSVSDTQTRLAGESILEVARPARTVRDLAILLLVVAALVVAVELNPSAAGIAMSRLLLPYGSAQWPARTGVESLMSQIVHEAFVHPRGKALTLRAKVTKGPPDQRVDAHYRMKVEGRLVAWRPAIVLTPQGQGPIHERLVDTNAEAIEVYFQTEDAATEPQTITLVPPPAVTRATLSVTPPSYAASYVAALESELGPGVDERAATDAPSLIGSSATLRLELNAPLPVPDDPQQRRDWLARTLSWAGGDLPSFSLDTDDHSRWTLRWTLAGTRALNLNLRDDYGLENAEPITYRIDAAEDRLPSVTVTQPQADEAVLATAVVGLVAEARDDVALSAIGLEAQRQKTDDKAAPDPHAWTRSRDVQSVSAAIDESLDLTTLSVREGDTVLVTAIADDVYDIDGQTHDPVRSAARRLRVISEVELGDQLRRELSALRQNAIRIEAMQGELQDDVIDDGVQPGVSRAQAQIGQRVGDQRSALEHLQQRMKQNRLSDEQLGDVVQQSHDLLDAAGKAANRAVEAAEQRLGQEPQAGREPTNQGDRSSGSGSARSPQSRAAAASQRPSPAKKTSPRAAPAPKGEGRAEARHDEGGAPADEEPTPAPQIREAAEQDKPLVEAQQDVREELADLIKLLDSDEDTWVVTRMLESLLQDQARLEAETAAMNQHTMGRHRDELSAEELSELDRIAQKQRDLAERSRQLAEQLRQRGKDLDEVDPQSAAGLRTAADTAEHEELDRNMAGAAEQMDENQLQSARSSQQSAQRTMQRMLQDIAQTRRARTEELQRHLSSLIESIQRLIVLQENELTALAKAAADGQFTGRDRAMIRLNQNTQAVAVEARAAGQEARRVARSLDRAADAQGAAVAAFRAQPPDADEAQTAEERSLELLKEAGDLAKKVLEKAQADQVQQRREELLEAYRKFAEKQVAVRTQTLTLAQQGELERRQLVEARLLGNAEDEIRTGLRDLRDATHEIADSPIFSHVHALIDRWTQAVTEGLRQGDVGVNVSDRQLQVADSIGRLITALQESMDKPPEFAQEQGGGGDGGGQEPLILPVAQLRLLRGVQDQIYNLTRNLDSRADLSDLQRHERLGELEGSQRTLMELGLQMFNELKGGPREAPGQPAPPDPPPPPSE